MELSEPPTARAGLGPGQPLCATRQMDYTVPSVPSLILIQRQEQHCLQQTSKLCFPHCCPVPLGLQGRLGCAGLAPPWAPHALGAPGHLFNLTDTSPPTACLGLWMEKPWLLPRLHFLMEVFLPGAFELSKHGRETAPLRHPFHPHCHRGLGFKHWGLSRPPGLQPQGYCGTKGTTSLLSLACSSSGVRLVWESSAAFRQTHDESHSRRSQQQGPKAQVQKIQTTLPHTLQNTTASRRRCLQWLRGDCPSHLLSPTAHPLPVPDCHPSASCSYLETQGQIWLSPVLPLPFLGLALQKKEGLAGRFLWERSCMREQTDLYYLFIDLFSRRM